MREPVQPAIRRMGLYIPETQALAHIKRGSAIVGIEEGEFILCAFEGGIYQEMDLSEKITIACWRRSDKPSNIAYVNAKADQVREIGVVTWDNVLRGWVIEHVNDEATFSQWFGEAPIIGGTADQHSRAAGLIINDPGNLGAIMEMERARNAGEDCIAAIIAYARR